MGWGSGAELMSDIIFAIKDDMSNSARKRLYEKLIPIFQGMDWDTGLDCLGGDIAFD